MALQSGEVGKIIRMRWIKLV